MCQTKITQDQPACFRQEEVIWNNETEPIVTRTLNEGLECRKKCWSRQHLGVLGSSDDSSFVTSFLLSIGFSVPVRRWSFTLYVTHCFLILSFKCYVSTSTITWIKIFWLLVFWQWIIEGEEQCMKLAGASASLAIGTWRWETWITVGFLSMY